MSSKTIKNADHWKAAAAELVGPEETEEPVSFIGQCEWLSSDPSVAVFFDFGAGVFEGANKQVANVKALKVGTTTISVTVDGDTHECLLTVAKHFDRLEMTWTKVG